MKHTLDANSDGIVIRVGRLDDWVDVRWSGRISGQRHERRDLVEIDA